jgi:phosphoglycolate phosphatase
VHWVQGPEAGVPAKPEPAILHACLERIGASSRESVYVGDMVLDVESAARAGVPIVLVPGGSSSTADLRRTGEHVLGSFGELAELLGPAAGAD